MDSATLGGPDWGTCIQVPFVLSVFFYSIMFSMIQMCICEVFTVAPGTTFNVQLFTVTTPH